MMRTGETAFRARSGLVRPGRPGRPRAVRRGGFTLTEIMIAMGVLAVGMGMIAGALHAGIRLHARTIDDIMRQLIADNALALVQARVRHTDNTGNGIQTSKYICLNTSGNYFGSGDLKYPWNETGSPYGAAVFMKRRAIDATRFANDYDVIVVPYTIIADSSNQLGTPDVKEMASCTVSAGNPGSTVTVTATYAKVLKAGSVVIDNRNAQVSFVQSVTNDTTVVLRDTLTAGNGPNLTLTTITASNYDIGGRLDCSKPAQTKTALTPAPPGWVPGS